MGILPLMPSYETPIDSALNELIDPELERPLGQLKMVRNVEVRRRKARVTIALPGPGYPAQSQESLVSLLQGALVEAGGPEGAEIAFEMLSDADQREVADYLATTGGDGQEFLPVTDPKSKTRVIGVSSGKGGVGKSSVAVNLAIALSLLGHKSAILDADVYGFSVPKMLGVTYRPMAVDRLVIPPKAQGVRCLSMGFFVGDDQPVIWRGPMLHKALEQFLKDAWWGDIDFLVVDMPPGTGDVAMSMAGYLPRTEVLVVTTPQPAAQRVAQRSALAAKQLKLPLRGVIENMSWFRGDDGKKYELFGSGGGQALADSLKVPLLGQVPLVPALREGADIGQPITASEPSSEPAQAFTGIAKQLASLGAPRRYRAELSVK